MNSPVVFRGITSSFLRTGILILVGGIFIWTVIQQPFAVRLQENIFDAVNPTAERAFFYGERHFNALDPREYDIVRAEMMYRKALARDEKLPYVHHQLARIAFLKGDFGLAMAYINAELALPKPSPASYYIRALIKGYLKDYLGAAEDYETYFKVTDANWAAINDYSWVLLKAELPELALKTLDWGLAKWPTNAWLLTNRATALYELGRFDDAATAAVVAQVEVEKITPDIWLLAYPGNDPLIARDGVAAFKKAAADNVIKMREAALNQKHPK